MLNLDCLFQVTPVFSGGSSSLLFFAVVSFGPPPAGRGGSRAMLSSPLLKRKTYVARQVSRSPRGREWLCPGCGMNMDELMISLPEDTISVGETDRFGGMPMDTPMKPPWSLRRFGTLVEVNGWHRPALRGVLHGLGAVVSLDGRKLLKPTTSWIGHQ